MKICFRCKESKPLDEFRGTYCLSCKREYQREHYLADKNRAAKQRAYYWNNREDKLKQRRLRTYGEEVDKKHYCETCGCFDNLVIDHDHLTNEVRGTLCSNCNRALGLVHDSPKVLRNLADYLERGEE